MTNQLDINKKKGYELFEKKNNDYGNAFELFGNLGILIRIIDKLSRLENLLKINDSKIDESIEDTIIDIQNYTILCLILLNNNQEDSITDYKSAFLFVQNFIKNEYLKNKLEYDFQYKSLISFKYNFIKHLEINNHSILVLNNKEYKNDLIKLNIYCCLFNSLIKFK